MAENRFAISLLSKDRKDEAINEEVMIDKTTGEVMVKGLNGEFISYNKISRLLSHSDRVSSACHRNKFLGKLYSVTLDDHDLPTSVPEATNLLGATTQDITATDPMEGLLLSLDLDTYKNLGDNEAVTFNQFETIVDVDILMAYNITQDIEYNETLSLPISQLNNTVIRPTYPDWSGDIVEYDVKITNIEINRSPNNAPTDVLRMVLHSIIIVLKEV